MRYTFFAPYVSVRLNCTVCAFKSKINCISVLKSCRATLCVQGDHCGWTLRFVYFELLLLLCFGQMKIRQQQCSNGNYQIDLNKILCLTTMVTVYVQGDHSS